MKNEIDISLSSSSSSVPISSLLSSTTEQQQAIRNNSNLYSIDLVEEEQPREFIKLKDKKPISKFTVSKVIIRLEIEDLSDREEDKIQNLIKFNSSTVYEKESVKSPLLLEENLIEKYSEKFSTKQEALLNFIGKREFKKFKIETFMNTNLIRQEKTKRISKMNQQNHNNQNQQHMANAAMTMQKALDIAYSDWNKEKTKSQSSNNDSISEQTYDESKKNELLDDIIKNENEKTSELINREQKIKTLALIDSLDSNFILKSKQNKEERREELMNINAENIVIPVTQIQEIKDTDTTESINEKDSNLFIKPDKSSTISNANTAEIPFYYGNPTVDIVKGFVHIYKDCNLSSFELSESSKSSSKIQPQTNSINNKESSRFRSEMLCIIGIPASINCNELLDFIMPFNDNIEYVRIIRDTYPNQYMALLKFKTQADADDFFAHNNNKSFNSIEDNVCHLAFVERIEAINSSKGASLPIPGFTELPTCHICLERMDESLNGVITILCNHSFHSNCLSKWGDTTCPVCRYSQTPDFTLDNTCTECGSHENLWICLICGHIGCGRYVRGHAYNHFQLTQHTYSMQLGSNRVWDYAADNYVHRLIQNKTDGKLVRYDEGGRMINNDDKIDSITLELESQRSYFEDRIEKIESKAKFQVTELENKSKQFEFENSKLQESVINLTKEKNNLEKKCSTLTSKVAKLQTELDEEKELNKCLSSNQEIYQKKLQTLEDNVKMSNQEKDKEILDLQSQLKDIMFYLDAQSKINEMKEVSNEEIQQSQMIIQENENEASSGIGAHGLNKSANRRRKKK